MQSVANRGDPAHRRPVIPTGNGRDGANTIVAPLFLRGLPALPSRSCRTSLSAITATTKRLGAVAPALQAAPSLLALIETQIVRRQRVSLATVARYLRARCFAAIDIGEVDDGRTISREQAPATISKSITYKRRPATTNLRVTRFARLVPLEILRLRRAGRVGTRTPHCGRPQPHA
jgi:hypothetical protein